MKKALLFVIIVLTFSSCKIVKSIRELKRTEVKTYNYNFENKEIVYLPMHHLGKNEFYEDVNKTVIDYKNKGFIVFYELISTDFTTDIELRNDIRRKVRKIKGTGRDYSDVTKTKIFKNYVKQPNYKLLGTDETDVRADVDYLTLINEYEKKFGRIVLDSIDIATDFEEPYERRIITNKKSYQYIIIDFRNDHLIETIKKSPNSKILILYGEGHRKNFQNKLRI